MCTCTCVCMQEREKTKSVQVAGWELSELSCDAGACTRCCCSMFWGACDWWVCMLACVCWVALACACTLTGCGKHSEGRRRLRAFVWLCPRRLCPARSSLAQGRVASPSLLHLCLCHLTLPLPKLGARPLFFSATGPWAGFQQPRPAQCWEGEEWAGVGLLWTERGREWTE